MKTTYTKASKFDENQLDRIKHLILLIGKCLSYNAELINRMGFQNLNEYNTFYSTIADIASLLVVEQINDEGTACLENRGPVGEIIYAACAELDPENLRLAITGKQDIEKTFKNGTDFINGSAYLDFTVSTYSALEKWMVNIYDKLREKHPSTNSKRNKIKSLIEKYIQEKDNSDAKTLIIDKIIESGGSYVSGGGKIDFVFSLIDENKYARNKKSDKCLISFYSKLRNTIHNLGHNKNDTTIEMPGSTIQASPNRPLTTTDFSENVKLCSETIDIYRAILEVFDLYNDHCCIEIKESF